MMFTSTFCAKPNREKCQKLTKINKKVTKRNLLSKKVDKTFANSIFCFIFAPQKCKLLHQ